MIVSVVKSPIASARWSSSSMNRTLGLAMLQLINYSIGNHQAFKHKIRNHCNLISKFLQLLYLTIAPTFQFVNKYALPQLHNDGPTPVHSNCLQNCELLLEIYTGCWYYQFIELALLLIRLVLPEASIYHQSFLQPKAVLPGHSLRTFRPKGRYQPFHDTRTRDKLLFCPRLWLYGRDHRAPSIPHHL